MILDQRFGATIVTIDPSFCVSELRRHRLTFYRTIQLSECHFHVHNTSTADGTFERGLHMILVTDVMYAMTTWHEYDCLRRGKHVFATDWTIAVGGTLDTTMCIPYGYGKTSTTSL